jgi:Epoxide hydrolase N terminus
MQPQPFEVNVPQAVLDDLNARLATTRLPADSANDWQAGMNPTALKELVHYWHTGFDWRAQEAKINRFKQFKAEVGDTTLHSREGHRRSAVAACADSRLPGFGLAVFKVDTASDPPH